MTSRTTSIHGFKLTLLTNIRPQVSKIIFSSTKFSFKQFFIFRALDIRWRFVVFQMANILAQNSPKTNTCNTTAPPRRFQNPANKKQNHITLSDLSKYKFTVIAGYPGLCTVFWSNFHWKSFSTVLTVF